MINSLHYFFVLFLGASLGVTQVSAVKNFQYKNYNSIVSDLQQLASEFPEYIEVFTAQDRYDLHSPGQCGSDPCQQHVAIITKKSTLTDDETRPEVFFSGCLHGNERIGPTTLIESINLLVHAAACVDGGNQDACQIDEPYQSWLSFLVVTRVIVVMPMTNSLGYFQNVREENHIDPNRDFPYDQTPKNCMQTVAARSVNEVWREHIFQLALTFHGGMTAIAYEWGAPNHPGPHQDVSPDDVAQTTLTKAMSSYSGHFTGQKAYPHGRLNDLVYPVHGGMEDWGYGSSWDTTSTCNPNTFGGYPVAKTQYNDATLRAFNILIETSNSKQPQSNTLGSDEELFFYNGQGNGHIPRNVRLVLMITDLVQPHLPWKSGPGLERTGWNFAPTSNWYYSGQVSRTSDSLSTQTTFEWGVWGAMSVDETSLFLGVWQSSFDEYNDAISADCLIQSEGVSSICQTSGDGRWGHPDTREEHPSFFCEVDWGMMEDGEYFLIAKAKVDQNWKTQPRTHYPNLPPQSHIVNARTNTDWDMQSNGHRVKGTLEWYSFPMKISVQTIGSQPEMSINTSPPTLRSTHHSTPAPETSTQVETLHPFTSTTMGPTIAASGAKTFTKSNTSPTVPSTTCPPSLLHTDTEAYEFDQGDVSAVKDQGPGKQTRKGNGFSGKNIMYLSVIFSSGALVVLLLGFVVVRRILIRRHMNDTAQTPYFGVDFVDVDEDAETLDNDIDETAHHGSRRNISVV